MLRTLAALTLVLLAAAPRGPAPTARAAEEVVIGALLSLTGPGATLGRTSQAALEIAVDEINRTFLPASPTRVRLLVEDTRLDPDEALDRLRSLVARGARIVVGPQSSAEVRALKPFADANGVLLLSQGSTASALAIPDDNVFRFVPDDSREIQALTVLLATDGVTNVVPAWRADLGNEGLQASLRALFPRVGGTVYPGVSYPPEETRFQDTVAALREQVAPLLVTQDPSTVAVYLAAFDEAAAILEAASRDPVLSAVRWYGSDGVALSDALLRNPAAASFAARTGYPNPTIGLDARYRETWQPLVEEIRARTAGTEPDAFALAAYDAAWVGALALLATQLTTDPATLRGAVLRVANSYVGATGPTALNAAGDRAQGSYDFWAVRDAAPGFAWYRVARYEADPRQAAQLVVE